MRINFRSNADSRHGNGWSIVRLGARSLAAWAAKSRSLRNGVLWYVIKMYAVAFKLVFERTLREGYATTLADDASGGLMNVINRDPRYRRRVLHRDGKDIRIAFVYLHHGCNRDLRAYGYSPGYAWALQRW